MADRVIDIPNENNVPNMPDELNHVLVYALNAGRDLLNDGKMLVPFTVLLVGDKPFVRQHAGANAKECYALAKHEVEGARGAKSYAFCYDGYLDTSEGMKDAIIAEGGVPGAETGYAIGYLYTVGEDGKPKVSTTASFIGKAPNFMGGLVELEEAEEAEGSVEKAADDAIDTVEKGERLERDNAEEFGEPTKDGE